MKLSLSELQEKLSQIPEMGDDAYNEAIEQVIAAAGWEYEDYVEQSLAQSMSELAQSES